LGRTKIRSLFGILLACVAGILFVDAAAAKETIVFVRHGEKPKDGLGQLSCPGLNRALKLPGVLAKAFFPDLSVKPAAIFAPNPSVKKDDKGKDYDYVRPLATIEPTAIALGMPIDVDIGFDDAEALRKALEGKRFRNALVLVAWEHSVIPEVARKLLKENGGDPDKVDDWDKHDFDSIYVVTIDWANETADFERKREGLDGQPDACP
jgi:hypothetical protein